MDNSFQRQESDTQQKGSFLAGLQNIESILSFIRRSVNWLAGFLLLTEEEQKNAGVYLGRMGDH